MKFRNTGSRYRRDPDNECLNLHAAHGFRYSLMGVEAFIWMALSNVCTGKMVAASLTIRACNRTSGRLTPVPRVCVPPSQSSHTTTPTKTADAPALR